MSREEQDQPQELPGAGTGSARTESKAERRARRAQKQAALVAKQQEALRLKMAGATFLDIARQLGYTHESAARKAYLAALHMPGRENRREARRLMRLRLERLLLTWWPRSLAGQEKATDRVLAILGDLRRLDALDLPRSKRLEHSGPGGGPIEHKDSQAPDWSQLSVEDLQELKAIHERLQGRGQAEESAPTLDDEAAPAADELSLEPAGPLDDPAAPGGEVPR